MISGESAVMKTEFDVVVKGAGVVRATGTGIERLDIGIRDGRFARLAPDLPEAAARRVIDGRGRLAFPGAVDAHMHTGIYSPLEQDAVSESRAAATGGVTTSLNYTRTGQYYLNKGGPYREFMPEVLATSAGRFHVDYGYHVAPMDRGHIDEIDALIREFGVTSFKIYMFYGGHGLHGASSDQSQFLMIGRDERYDIAHFEFVMRGVKRALDEHRAIADRISLSLHCETAEIMAAYTKIVQTEGRLTGLRAYHASRPPHSEGLAICIASYLAHETECLNVNLLHLTSRKAVEAALTMAQAFPHINFGREATIGHLLMDVDSPAGPLAKVNPPIRPREDVEFLWQAVLAGQIDWIVSDHACCRHEMKVDGARPQEIFMAKSGFGGTEYLVSGLFSEGRKRGLGLNRMAQLLSLNPARRFGCVSKGDIAVGLDADLLLLDPDRTFTVRAAESPSTQGYTPFEGQELTGQVTTTLLRGEIVYADGAVQGAPRGRYIDRRP
jgi:allantoinase